MDHAGFVQLRLHLVAQIPRNCNMGNISNETQVGNVRCTPNRDVLHRITPEEREPILELVTVSTIISYATLSQRTAKRVEETTLTENHGGSPGLAGPVAGTFVQRFAAAPGRQQ
ncbi:hypothetical protein EYF80_034791 [Liparis tanakae]|uniref:Uncharacterized protein n=1 Tax=Liparis tanakae TaxID=230148 RepID=A0A4Z2GQK7_9TELE|nr:hypothetical protein EYF80_034791 [Liparis tanakae]